MSKKPLKIHIRSQIFILSLIALAFSQPVIIDEKNNPSNPSTQGGTSSNPCGPGCQKAFCQTSQKKCTKCKFGYRLNPKTSKCVKCLQVGCEDCQLNERICKKCQLNRGFFNQGFKVGTTNGVSCGRCSKGCMNCDSAQICNRCLQPIFEMDRQRQCKPSQKAMIALLIMVLIPLCFCICLTIILCYCLRDCCKTGENEYEDDPEIRQETGRFGGYPGQPGSGAGFPGTSPGGGLANGVLPGLIGAGAGIAAMNLPGMLSGGNRGGIGLPGFNLPSFGGEGGNGGIHLEPQKEAFAQPTLQS